MVEDLSFSVEPGRTLGLVGESGSGKTVSALAVMGLLPHQVARVTGGSVRFEGRNLLGLDRKELRAVRGDQIAMIFQDPMTSLNPAFTVGNQIAEQVRAHREVSRADARRVAVEMLDRVEIPGAASRASDYPHQFSGGMRQRVMIAMALSCSPRLLIADEPTTALDVTTEAQILDLLRTLTEEESMAMIFVTHDLGVIAEIADEVVVMYAGQKVEHATAGHLFVRPRHPYTEALLSSMPQSTPIGSPLPVIPGVVPRPEDFPCTCRFRDRCRHAVEVCGTTVVELRPTGAADDDAAGPAEGWARCLRQDQLHLTGASAAPGHGDGARAPGGGRPGSAGGTQRPRPGQAVPHPLRGPPAGDRRKWTPWTGCPSTSRRALTLGLVGESGSGKSTLARLVVRIIEPTAGSVVVDGTDVTVLSGAELAEPAADADGLPGPLLLARPQPHHRGHRGQSPWSSTAASRPGRAGSGPVSYWPWSAWDVPLDRYPNQFSGGQRQRIAIARALAVNPSLLVCDEAVSALDVSTQAQVLNLLAGLQRELGTAYLFISHDLSVVRHIGRHTSP